jgi:phage tail-like protein
MRLNEIEQLLPGVFQQTLREGGPLLSLLEVMEQLHEPSEAVLGRLDAVFDPRRTADEFVPFLAGWVDLERLFDFRPAGRQQSLARSPITSGIGRLRELIATAAHLSRWRGTEKGLLLFLRTATGSDGFAVDEQVPGEDGRPKPFHIRVRAPAEAAEHRALIERIIELEKPAYVTYELEFGQPTPGE